jgi:hypothetical protein
MVNGISMDTVQFPDNTVHLDSYTRYLHLHKGNICYTST